MATFVLVHGAWHGGWCWKRVSSRLRAAGHEVFTPTLTGLSDRAHVLSPSVNLSTHVIDIVKLIDAEALTDVVLVGHSYAGMIITAVAQQRPKSIKTRVYLDAFVPENGEAAIDLLPENVAHHYHESVEGPGFGWLIPPRSLSVLGVSEQDDLDWLTPRLTPHPWATYTEAIFLDTELTGNAAYIECTDWMRVFQPYAQRAADKGWPVYEIATGHEAMVTAPEELSDLLNKIAS